MQGPRRGRRASIDLDKEPPLPEPRADQRDALDRTPEWKKPLRAHRPDGGMPADGAGPSAPIYQSEVYRENLVAVGGNGAEFHFMLLDLDNGSGVFRHQAGDRLSLLGVDSYLIKSRGGDIWRSLLAVVTRVGATDSDLAVLRPGTMRLREARQEIRETIRFYPFELDVTVRGGQLLNVTPSLIITTPNITTTTPIPGPVPAGPTIQPAVGDIVVRVVGIGNGNGFSHHMAHYRTGH